MQLAMQGFHKTPDDDDDDDGDDGDMAILVRCSTSTAEKFVASWNGRYVDVSP